MKKVKIQVCALGTLPKDLNKIALTKVKSEIFSVEPEIHTYEIRVESDLYDWAYSDDILATLVPESHEADILVVLTSVPLELNYYTRRLHDNVVVFTFYEISKYLKFDNIPLGNVVKRLFYSYALAYLRNNRRIPTSYELSNFTHDDTRGCIYDMNGVKEDISTSCHKPIVCDECCDRMKTEKISLETIKVVKSELANITKNRYFVIADWVKENPILSLFISSVWAVSLGVVGSIIAGALSGA
ncbi:hypothetical protein Vca1114GL_00067 [Vibrio campbellii]|uniref:hypothetical protein n=1 Tax=Vibrio campbellii TaxID=680 RepID=UPI00097FB7FE|nr:hypothetical protein [Vibrio campbellii]AQM66590.1 hypothetical protein Vca1114GL_00067 [Vibrio campbellii]